MTTHLSACVFAFATVSPHTYLNIISIPCKEATNGSEKKISLHSMPPNQYCISIRIFAHGRLQTIRQILFATTRNRSTCPILDLVCSKANLLRSIFDNRYSQSVKIPQIPLFPSALANPFDLLHITYFKAAIRTFFPFDEEGHQHRPL